MKKVLSLLAAGILMLGCIIPSFPATETTPSSPGSISNTGASADCSSLKITDEEVLSTRQYIGNVLSNGDWINDYYTVTPTNVTVDYASTGLHARIQVFTSVLCSANTVLKNYITETNFDFLFRGYDGYSITDSCEKDGILFYQFSATSQGSTFTINSWTRPLEDGNHFMLLSASFPESDAQNLNFYSEAFYPNFTSCN